MMRLFTISIVAIGTLSATACNFRPLPKLTDAGGDDAPVDDAGTDDAATGPVAIQCTPMTSVPGGTGKACVQQDSAGQFAATVDVSISARDTVSVKLLACNPVCSTVQSSGAFVAGQAHLVTRPKVGMHGYLYKASFSVDTSGPPAAGFESGVIVYP